MRCLVSVLLIALVCVGHAAAAAPGPGRKLQQNLCWVRGRYVPCYRGGGRTPSSRVNQQQFATSLAIQNTQDAIEWAATSGGGEEASFAARYGAVQNRCAADLNWPCLTSSLYGRKLLRGPRA